MMALAAHLPLEKSSIELLQGLRRRYGDGPLRLRAFGRDKLVILSADHLAQVLAGAPEPFTPATTEKHAALARFEPNVSLITRGPARAARRRFNEKMLESERPIHRCADLFAGIIRDKASRLCAFAQDRHELTWPLFTDAWYAAARHIVLGPTAAEDRSLTNDLARLRAVANWVVLPSRPKVRARYRQKLASYLAKPGEGSLSAMIANRQPDGDESPLDQVTQWLFAFDGGGMTVFRALAVLLTSNLNTDIAVDLKDWGQGRTDLPFLRAAVLDAARLWPTTPVLLRQATRETSIGSCKVPHDASIAIYLPFFHRDCERVATADRFAPEFWRGRDPADAAPFVPFSAGPAACPGRHLVSLVGSLWLAALFQGGVVNLLSHSLSGPPAPLPTSLNPFALRFGLGNAEMTRCSR